jgi:DNA polymerase-3 subunit gamma/tau
LGRVFYPPFFFAENAMFDTTQAPAQESGVYQVLARRTRPQAFAELVGQDVVSTALSSMIQSGVIPHAFLFTGTRGTGKTSSARILAKSLCCVKGPTASPCQTCVHCKQITAGAHDDILEIDAASNTGVDNIRDLREAAQFYPNSARYKIYIIDEVHMLSMSAFNALLKTLEEPPPNVIFILATTELHKVPLTVRSRCVIFSFRKIAPETIAAHLAGILEREGVTFDADALALIAREAKGSMRDSLSLLEQARALCGNKHIDLVKTREALSILGQELAEKLVSAISCGTAADALDALRTADAASVDLSSLLEDAAALFRNALIMSQCTNETDARRLTQLLPSEMESLRTNTAHISAAALSEVFRVLSNGAREAARATAGLAWAEIAVLDAISRREWLSASELLGVLRGEASNEKPTSQFRRPEAVRPTEVVRPTAALRPVESAAAPAAPSAPAAVPVPAISMSSGAPSALSSTATETPAGLAAGSPIERFQAVIDFLNKDGSPTPVRLAHKLSKFPVVRCEEKVVQFDCAGSLFQNLNESETKLFHQALECCGLGGAEIKGIQLFKASPTQVASAQPVASAKPVTLVPPPVAARSVADFEKDKRVSEEKARTERAMNSPAAKAWSTIGSDHQFQPVEEDE